MDINTDPYGKLIRAKGVVKGQDDYTYADGTRIHKGEWVEDTRGRKLEVIGFAAKQGRVLTRNIDWYVHSLMTDEIVGRTDPPAQECS